MNKADTFFPAIYDLYDKKDINVLFESIILLFSLPQDARKTAKIRKTFSSDNRKVFNSAGNLIVVEKKDNSIYCSFNSKEYFKFNVFNGVFQLFHKEQILDKARIKILKKKKPIKKIERKVLGEKWVLLSNLEKLIAANMFFDINVTSYILTGNKEIGEYYSSIRIDSEKKIIGNHKNQAYKLKIPFALIAKKKTSLKIAATIYFNFSSVNKFDKFMNTIFMNIIYDIDLLFKLKRNIKLEELVGKEKNLHNNVYMVRNVLEHVAQINLKLYTEDFNTPNLERLFSLFNESRWSSQKKKELAEFLKQRKYKELVNFASKIE